LKILVIGQYDGDGAVGGGASLGNPVVGVGGMAFGGDDLEVELATGVANELQRLALLDSGLWGVGFQVDGLLMAGKGFGKPPENIDHPSNDTYDCTRS